MCIRALRLKVNDLAMRVCMTPEAAGEPDLTLEPGKDAELATAIKRYPLLRAPLAVFGGLSGMGGMGRIGGSYVIAGMLILQDPGMCAAAHGLAS